MTSFVHVDHPTQHNGVVRAQRVTQNFKNLASRFDGARAAATLLLAAVVAALMVVANELVDTWTEGHLLAAWVMMWTVAFAAIGLFATPAKRAVGAGRQLLKAWAAEREQALNDEKLWNVALTDARVMADISRAMSADATRDIKNYY